MSVIFFYLGLLYGSFDPEFHKLKFACRIEIGGFTNNTPNFIFDSLTQAVLNQHKVGTKAKARDPNKLI